MLPEAGARIRGTEGFGFSIISSTNMIISIMIIMVCKFIFSMISFMIIIIISSSSSSSFIISGARIRGTEGLGSLGFRVLGSSSLGV